jgi:hypothetical protein
MIRLINKVSRSIGLAGDPSVVLDVGGVTEVTLEHFDNLRRNRRTRDWLEKGLVEAELLGKTAVVKPPEGVEIVPQGGGWFRVLVNGTDVGEKSLRIDEAEALAADYR